MDTGESHRFRGQGLVEYALLLVLVAIVVIVILTLLGPAVGNVFSEVIDPMSGPGDDTPGDCYSTLLIAMMVGAMSIATLSMQFVPSEWVDKISFAISRVA